jgi:selenocysteine lyase/cysteine desulfurase
MTPLDNFIGQFSEETGYLDFARVGPVGRAVVEEMQGSASLLATGRYGALPNLRAEDERVREAVGGLLGFPAEQVSFQPSRGQALMHTMFGLTGGIAIAPAEYPGITFAVARAAEALGVLEPKWLGIDHDKVTPGNLKRQLSARTTAVVVSVVGARTGYLVDLEGIRQVLGDRLLIVDATHALGIVDAPFALADVVVAGGQSWLRAGWGTGILALSERAIDQLTPVLSGYPAAADEEPPPGEVPPPMRGTAAFQVSVPDPVAQARLAAAVEAIARPGVSAINSALSGHVERLFALADEFAIPVSSPRDPADRAGIVMLRPEPDLFTPLAASLHNHGITVTSRDGTVRVSPHVSTSEETFAVLRAAFVEYSATVSRP